MGSTVKKDGNYIRISEEGAPSLMIGYNSGNWIEKPHVEIFAPDPKTHVTSLVAEDDPRMPQILASIKANQAEIETLSKGLIDEALPKDEVITAEYLENHEGAMRALKDGDNPEAFQVLGGMFLNNIHNVVQERAANPEQVHVQGRGTSPVAPNVSPELAQADAAQAQKEGYSGQFALAANGIAVMAVPTAASAEKNVVIPTMPSVAVTPAGGGKDTGQETLIDYEDPFGFKEAAATSPVAGQPKEQHIDPATGRYIVRDEVKTIQLFAKLATVGGCTLLCDGESALQLSPIDGKRGDLTNGCVSVLCSSGSERLSPFETGALTNADILAQLKQKVEKNPEFRAQVLAGALRNKDTDEPGSRAVLEALGVKNTGNLAEDIKTYEVSFAAKPVITQAVVP